MYNLLDTICAQSTPSGRGGLHVIRVSGVKALDSVRQIFAGFPSKVIPNYVYYGKITEKNNRDNIIDEVLVTYFQKGRSFTNEETVEISCHGNPLIVKLILNELVQLGCRLADRGEFTYRAYKNKRIDLSQAEAVLALIETNTPAFLGKALRMLGGDLSERLDTVEQDIIWVVSRLEAMIDFSTEDIEIEQKEVLLDRLLKAKESLTPLVGDFENRRILDRGIRTLILGPPNVGKSSLMNLFLGKKRAIVSETPGTTRDFLTEPTMINDKLFEIIDTAGIRATENLIENQGIEMAKELVETSDLVLVVLDKDNMDQFKNYESLINDKRTIWLLNKADELSDLDKNEIAEFFKKQNIVLNFLSVLSKEGLNEVKVKMSEAFSVKEGPEGLEVISVRQKSGLDEALKELSKGVETLNEGLGEEFILSHLNVALKNLLELKFISDDEIVRDKIFKDFCLGK